MLEYPKVFKACFQPFYKKRKNNFGGNARKNSFAHIAIYLPMGILARSKLINCVIIKKKKN